MKDILFSVQEISPPGISLQELFSSKSVCRIFLLKSPIPHLKSQMAGLLLHPEVTTVTCYELQIRMLARS